MIVVVVAVVIVVEVILVITFAAALSELGGCWHASCSRMSLSMMGSCCSGCSTSMCVRGSHNSTSSPCASVRHKTFSDLRFDACIQGWVIVEGVKTYIDSQSLPKWLGIIDQLALDSCACWRRATASSALLALALEVTPFFLSWLTKSR